MMKRFKTLAAVLVIAMVLILLPENSAVTAQADEHATYSVSYVSEKQEWRFIDGSSPFGDGEEGRELYYLYENMKDGDYVVVYNSTGTDTPLNLGSKHLGNLTVMIGTQWSVILTGGVDDCFVLDGSASAINGNITNAYVYGSAACSFNSNVSNMTVFRTNNEPGANVGCGGTVGHLRIVDDTDNNIVYHEVYNIATNRLDISYGSFNTDEAYYSVVASAASIPAASTSSASSDDEYDDVPKTGQNSLYLWLLCASAACFAGSRMLRRISR